MFLRIRKCILAVSLLVGLCCLGAAQEPDAVALRNLALKLHSGYAQKDREALLSLWSEKSPQRTTQREQLQKLFGGPAAVEIHEITEGSPDFPWKVAALA